MDCASAHRSVFPPATGKFAAVLTVGDSRHSSAASCCASCTRSTGPGRSCVRRLRRVRQPLRPSAAMSVEHPLPIAALPAPIRGVSLPSKVADLPLFPQARPSPASSHPRPPPPPTTRSTARSSPRRRRSPPLSMGVARVWTAPSARCRSRGGSARAADWGCGASVRVQVREGRRVLVAEGSRRHHGMAQDRAPSHARMRARGAACGIVALDQATAGAGRTNPLPRLVQPHTGESGAACDSSKWR